LGGSGERKVDRLPTKVDGWIIDFVGLSSIDGSVGRVGGDDVRRRVQRNTEGNLSAAGEERFGVGAVEVGPAKLGVRPLSTVGKCSPIELVVGGVYGKSDDRSGEALVRRVIELFGVLTV
jgi:hypothetical protein